MRVGQQIVEPTGCICAPARPRPATARWPCWRRSISATGAVFELLPHEVSGAWASASMIAMMLILERGPDHRRRATSGARRHRQASGADHLDDLVRPARRRTDVHQP